MTIVRETANNALTGETPTFGPLRVRGMDATFQAAYIPASFPLCVVFNGYLLDRNELRGELDADPVNDAGLVLLAYRRWGERLFEHIDGGFMIAVWDGAQGRFMLGRDGLGKHPAYYAIRSATLWFSVNVLALNRVSHIGAQPDPMCLARRIVFHPPPIGRTCFTGIRRVQPAHFLKAGPGEPAEQRYWNLLPDDDEPWLPDAEVMDGYEALLTRAVNRGLDLGAGGVLLSGGTDSVSVAALAATQARRRGLPIPTACCGKAPPGYDGGPDQIMQDRVSDLLHMPGLSGHALHWLGGRDLIGASLSYTPMLPAPTTAYWMGEFLGFYRHIVNRGIHTVMSGSGGDEWLGVHESYFTDLFRRVNIPRMVAFAGALARGRGAGLPRTMAQLLWKWALLYPVREHIGQAAPGLRARRRRGGLRTSLPVWLDRKDEIIDDLLADAHGARVPRLSPSADNDSRWYRYTVARLYRNPYMHHELERRHHLSHSLGLRMISPFQDTEAVHFFNRVSPDTLLKAAQTKGLLRRVIDKHLGDTTITTHPKLEGTQASYPHDQLRAHLGRYVAATDLAAVQELGLVDVDILMRRVRDPSSLSVPESIRIFGVLSTAEWLRCNF